MTGEELPCVGVNCSPTWFCCLRRKSWSFSRRAVNWACVRHRSNVSVREPVTPSRAQKYSTPFRTTRRWPLGVLLDARAAVDGAPAPAVAAEPAGLTGACDAHAASTVAAAMMKSPPIPLFFILVLVGTMTCGRDRTARDQAEDGFEGSLADKRPSVRRPPPCSLFRRRPPETVNPHPNWRNHLSQSRLSHVRPRLSSLQSTHSPCCAKGQPTHAARRGHDGHLPSYRRTAILHEEWKNGEQLTATVFYLVGSEVWTRSRHAAAADTIVQSIPPRASAVIHAIEPVSPKPKGSST